MLVLGIDTTTKIASCGLYDTEIGVVGEINLYINSNHSNVILSLIDTLLNNVDKNINDINKIVVSIGPGSFTGIRVGVGLAKGLAFNSNKSITSVCELDLLAYPYRDLNSTIVAMVDARKERVYCGIYKNGINIYPYEVDDIRYFLDKVKNETSVIFVGDGAIKNKKLINFGIIMDDTMGISRGVIVAKMGIDKDDNIYTLEPLYVNKSQAERERGIRK